MMKQLSLFLIIVTIVGASSFGANAAGDPVGLARKSQVGPMEYGACERHGGKPVTGNRYKKMTKNMLHNGSEHPDHYRVILYGGKAYVMFAEKSSNVAKRTLGVLTMNICEFR